jgi:hypothetical protein
MKVLAMPCSVIYQRWRHLQFSKLLFYCSVAILLWFSHLAHADIPIPPRPYKIATANNAYEFVMNVPQGNVPQPRKSGLYRTDKPDQPLWTVPWYAHRVTVSSDGKHLVRHGGWPLQGALEAEALSFFKNGRLIRTYSIKELITTPEGLQLSTSHFNWFKQDQFDDSKGLLYVSTMTGDSHVFDITNGQKISSDISDERKGKSEKIVDFGFETKTIALPEPQRIIGMTLPKGSWVTIGLRGGRILSAQLKQKAHYGNIILQPGSILGLRSIQFSPDNPNRREYWQEPKDEFADMKVYAITQPAPWKIGSLVISGQVHFEDNKDNLLMHCFSPAVCSDGKTKLKGVLFDAAWAPLHFIKATQ